MPGLRTNKHPRNRRVLDPARPKMPLTAVPVITVATTTVTFTFTVPVIVTGIPLTFTVATRTVTAITIVSATVFTLTLSGSGATLAYSLLANDPAIRTYSGGFAAAAAGTFP